MSILHFGWSEVRLKPEGRTLNVVGQFYERITDVERDPICVTALAIESEGECAIFCAGDLTSASHHLLESVRAILREDPAFPADRVMLSATHTHTSMGYARRSDTYGGSLDVLKQFMPEGVEYKALVTEHPDNLLDGEEAHAVLAERIAQAAKEAWANRAPGQFASAFGRAAVGMCRRVSYDDGSAKMWGDTDMANFTQLEGGNDSGIELLFVKDAAGKLTGVVANVACPSQTLEHRSLISADYWGGVKARLRASLGEDLFLLPLCSAAGDQCPRDLVRWVEPETPINDPNIVRSNVTPRVADPSMFDVKGCETIARRIATEILWAYEETTDYIADAPFAHVAATMDVPLRRVTIAERDAAAQAIEAFFKAHTGPIDYHDNARLHIHAGTLSRYALQQTVELDTIEVHFLRLGNVAFATNPYELFLDYGNQIRARTKAAQTFLIQLSCGSKGYLPTAKAEAGSHYSAYVSSGTTGHIGGELLVRNTIRTINDLMQK